jgi:predicted HTH transcriptional regulator
LFANSEELLQHIELHGDSEGRSFEYKSGLPWDKGHNEFKIKIIKAILCMSNLRDGGDIIIGVEKDIDGKYEAIGLNDIDSKTYDREKVLEAANSYADPFIDIDLKTFPIEDKWLVVIYVHEFKEIPVVCKKNFQGILEQGRIYARTFRKPECTATITSSNN